MSTLLNLNISIVSPKNIINWSSRNILGIMYIGEVYSPYTINYSSGAPSIGGLFCDKIFGPIISWKCRCSNTIKLYKHICLLCGDEINNNLVRRFRMGVIILHTPVFHSWYFGSKLSLLPLFLNCSYKILDDLVYYNYCTNIKNYMYNENFINETTMFKFRQIIYINYFIKNYLNSINIIENIVINKEKLLINFGDIEILYKKLFFLNIFFFNKLSLSWVLLDNFPIIPPELRPIVKINKTQFVVSSINNMYKTILIHNNKLKYLLYLEKKIPLIFEINEKIKLQKSIDNILRKNIKYKNFNLILKSLSGKLGMFRQNLLGKRVDYSARSVIISGPDINFSKVGIPISIACDLFSPILLSTIKKYKTIKYILNNLNYIYISLIYRRLITRIFKKNVILINRAPTLHRVNIQGFKPYLVEGHAIKLYPMVCSSFNADFDGDQMSVLLTITKPSRLETKYIVSSDKNFLSPATGLNLFKVNQIILLGLFFLNILYYKRNKLKYIYLNSIDDLLNFISAGIIELQDNVWIRLKYLDIKFNILIDNFIFTNAGRLVLTKLINLN